MSQIVKREAFHALLNLVSMIHITFVAVSKQHFSSLIIFGETEMLSSYITRLFLMHWRNVGVRSGWITLFHLYCLVKYEIKNRFFFSSCLAL